MLNRSLFTYFIHYENLARFWRNFSGSVVLIHGCVAHKSEANTSTKRRHSYAFHIVDRENSSYSDDNW